MPYRKVIWLLTGLLLAVLFPVSAAAQDSDTLNVSFKLGESRLDMNYLDNRARVDAFAKYIRSQYESASSDLMEIDILSGASPDGSPQVNFRLGEQRGLSLKRAVQERLSDLPIRITVNNVGPRWDDLYKMVEASDEPWKQAVLDIISKKPETEEWTTNVRERELRKLDGGKVWLEIKERYLPPLRSTGSAVLVIRRPEIPETERQRDTLVIMQREEIHESKRDTVVIMQREEIHESKRDTLVQMMHINQADDLLREELKSIRDSLRMLQAMMDEYMDSRPAKRSRGPVVNDRLLALKSNVPLLGLLAPNVQLELPVSENGQWSVQGGFLFPFWRFSNNSLSWHILDFSAEGRYYLGNRKYHSTLAGAYLGAGLSGGYYDLAWIPHQGYQGEYFRLYVGGGYQLRFGSSRRWVLDAGLGLGFVATGYRSYLGSSIYPPGMEEATDKHLMWQESAGRFLMGPVHACVSVGYLVDGYGLWNRIFGRHE